MSDPYQTPVESLIDDSELSNLELRSRYRNEESKVLAVGGVYYLLGSLLFSVGGVGAYYCAMKLSMFHLLPCGAFALLGLMFIIIGFGLRRFDNWSRVSAVVAAAIALFIIPVGTVVGILCLGILKRNALKLMFTSAYQAAVIEEGEAYDHFGWYAILVGLLAGAGAWLYLLTKGIF